MDKSCLQFAKKKKSESIWLKSIRMHICYLFIYYIGDKYPLCPSQNFLTNPTEISWINFTVCEPWQTVPINSFASSTMIIRKWKRRTMMIRHGKSVKAPKNSTKNAYFTTFLNLRQSSVNSKLQCIHLFFAPNTVLIINKC